jgi:hypothetical protein
MRTLRKLPAASLSGGRPHLPPYRPTAGAPLCTQATGQLLSDRDSKRGRVAYAPLRGLLLNTFKSRDLPAGSMLLTVPGANVHGPRDSDNRMCAQR